MIDTRAWVLHRAQGREEPLRERLRNEVLTFPEPGEEEVLAEPLYGCWEGNMSHAVERDPIDICRQRKEERCVIGNAGVVRVLEVGSAVRGLKEGDVCAVFCNGIPDERGYPDKIYAYDAPGTVGLLAKRTKLDQSWLIPIPEGSRLSLRQWAAFSLRYVTAWANWQASYGCWCALSGGGSADVWGWGGGVTYAQLTLARLLGSEATMITSDDGRLRLLESSGLRAVDRRDFPHLAFDADSYGADEGYKEAYQASENRFLEIVQERTGRKGVDIFVDYIGLPVHRATLKALGRPGVITTAGWKEGMMLNTVRALECMRWHAHVHTHYARYEQALAAMAFAEENAWAPPLDGERVYAWEEIPDLAEAYAANRITSFFPIFAVNPEE